MEPSAVKQETDIVLVTGSSGRIGKRVMDRFEKRPEDTVGFDRAAPAPPPVGCTYIPVDVTSDESVQSGLDTVLDHHGARIASVIHLAAYYSFSGRSSPLYDEITVEGTRRLLRKLRSGPFEVGQILFSSTMLVHAPVAPGERIREDSPIEPTWAYPASKVHTERVLREESGEIPVVSLRIAGVYDDRCHSIPLANQIQRIYEHWLAGRLYSGTTAHGQSFVHVDDVVDAIELAVDRRARLGPEQVFLLGETEVLTYDELQHVLAKLIHGESWETREIPRWFAKVGAWLQDRLPGRESFVKPWMIDRASDHYAVDISRAKELLGWVPRRSLRDSLPRMVDALRDDPGRWYRENELEPPRGGFETR